jgi:bacterioferritin-associated ferredoxin
MSVSEEEIATAIEAGATSIEGVGDRCEAGTGCQSCHEAISCMLREHSESLLQAGTGPGALQQLSLFGRRRRAT